MSETLRYRIQQIDSRNNEINKLAVIVLPRVFLRSSGINVNFEARYARGGRKGGEKCIIYETKLVACARGGVGGGKTGESSNI